MKPRPTRANLAKRHAAVDLVCADLRLKGLLAERTTIEPGWDVSAMIDDGQINFQVRATYKIHTREYFGGRPHYRFMAQKDYGDLENLHDERDITAFVYAGEGIADSVVFYMAYCEVKNNPLKILTPENKINQNKQRYRHVSTLTLERAIRVCFEHEVHLEGLEQAEAAIKV